MASRGRRGGDEPSFLSTTLYNEILCVACLNLDSPSLLLPEFLSPSASIYRWLGTFDTAREAGQAYDAAKISQKGCKAKTNFRYWDTSSDPRRGAETLERVRWELLTGEVAEVGKGSQCMWLLPTRIP